MKFIIAVILSVISAIKEPFKVAREYNQAIKDLKAVVKGNIDEDISR